MKLNFANLKLTALINAYSALKIPLLAFVTPQVIELTEKRSVVRLRLDPRSRNHLNVMYFGALAMGAELSIALKAIDEINKSPVKIDFIFKDFQAEFLKRADGHVNFICEQADQVAALVQKAATSESRHHQTFEGLAMVDGQSEPTMRYRLTLSVKQRLKKAL